MKSLFVLLASMAMLLSTLYVTSPVLAQGGGQVQSGLKLLENSFPTGPTRTSSLSELIKLFLDWALYFSAALAVVFIVIGGYLYITAGGNPDQAKKGRIALTNALIGLVMVIFSYTIVQVVYNFLISPNN